MFYNKNDKPSWKDKKELVKKAGLKFQQVDDWFKNIRRRKRKAEKNEKDLR